MKAVRCNYCGRDNSEVVNRGPDLYLNRPGDYRLVRCRNCGLIYQNPRLTREELLEHYPTTHYERYLPAAEEEETILRRVDRWRGIARRRKRITQLARRIGHLLDVGCATGSFLDMMRTHGWQVSGVELNPDAARYARQRLQLDVRTGTLEQAQFSSQAFDVVTMWDVFEHVLDPRQTLSEVRRILRPGGLLALSLPNPSSLEARLFGDSWAGWDRPRHLHLFTPAMLSHYLVDAGFQRPHIESDGGRLKVTLLSVAYACNARGIAREAWAPWLDALYNWPLRLLTWPIYRLAELFNQTTTMSAYAILADDGSGGEE